MRLKDAIVAVLNADELRSIVEEFELEVTDRRAKDVLASAITRAKRTRVELLLPMLSEVRVKEVCELMGVEPRGRKTALIERLIDKQDEAVTGGAIRPRAEVGEQAVKSYVAVQTADMFGGQVPGITALADAAPGGAFAFEPIKGYPMLNWRGKRAFTSTEYYPAQMKEVYGAEVDGWRNKIYWGDNLQVMSHLLRTSRGKIDLIYVDPPFDSKIEYKKKISTKGGSTESTYTAFEEKQYSDVWANDEYLQFIYERAILIRELLSESGVLCLHCDWHKSHYLRALLDEVFGYSSFQNEIVWHYYNKMQGNINRFASDHDVILVYSKSSNFTFNKLREKRDEPVQQIKRVWDKETQSLVNAKGSDGKVIYITATHKTIDDVWRLPMLQPADRAEVVGYPTQKPEALLERIVLAYSKPGDVVFDCFMGSGTTLAVASKYGRKFIGNDINLGAIQSGTKRLLALFGEMGSPNFVATVKNGLVADQADLIDCDPADETDWRSVFYVPKLYPGLEVSTVNNYDVFRNPAEAKEILLATVGVNRIDGNSAYDGEKDGRLVSVMPVNRIATRADLNGLIGAFDYKAWDRRQHERPNHPVEKIMLICMGHEPDLKAQLELAAKPYRIDVEVVDILREKSDLIFKKESEAKLSVKNGQLVIDRFYPMNLMQKLSLRKEKVGEWRELVESVMVDWNYDGAVLQPAVTDIPERNELVSGRYKVPADAGTIRVKITDLLSESWEGEVHVED